MANKWFDLIKLAIVEGLRVNDMPRYQSVEYPATVGECIDDKLKYRDGVHEVVARFRDSRPWKGTSEDMQRKFATLNASLAKVYEIDEPKLVFVDQFPVGPCCFPTSNPPVIMMERTRDGRYSVVAFLHEFAHVVVGWNEREVCRWSINLFKRHFPVSFANLEPRGHLLFKKELAPPQG